MKGGIFVIAEYMYPSVGSFLSMQKKMELLEETVEHRQIAVKTCETRKNGTEKLRDQFCFLKQA